MHSPLVVYFTVVAFNGVVSGCDTSSVVGKACAGGTDCFINCPGVRGVCAYNKCIVVPSLMLAPAYMPTPNGTDLPRAGSLLPKWCQDSLGGGIRYGEECCQGLCTGNPAYDGRYTDVSTGIQGCSWNAQYNCHMCFIQGVDPQGRQWSAGYCQEMCPCMGK